jgi:Transposase DDE domain
VGLLSLVSGAVVGLAIGPYKGKETGETALFRQLWDRLQSGDIIVGDRFFATFWDLAMLAARGIDSVYRQHQLRLTKNQRIRRLGAGDFLLRIPKPQRPEWMAEEIYAELPFDLVVRELEVQVKQRGFRVHHLTLVTTLLDADVYSAAELALVYRARWNAELDLRSIKITMQMDVLRCKTPEMVRKEIWMHLLAYNLIRTVMADAAQRRDCQPREISFKGTLQTLAAYRPQVETAPADALANLYEEVLYAVASHRVGNRPDRFEPRAIKRRPKPHDLLTVPRNEAKRRLVA